MQLPLATYHVAHVNALYYRYRSLITPFCYRH
nr:MAG TPA: hypothetical protein [Caudoviricetes sp.]